MPRQNLFLATDCVKLRDIVKDRLSKHYLFSFSAQHLALEGSVHAFKPEDTKTHNRSTIDLNTLVDLGLLALSESYYYVDPLVYGGWVSGSSRLAHFSHNNKFIYFT
jgi:hypothetical protein